MMSKETCPFFEALSTCPSPLFNYGHQYNKLSSFM